MANVTGSIIWNDPQIDGRHVVRELWTDDLGNEFTYDYIADVGMDINAKLAAREPQVLADAEAFQLAQAG